MKRLAVALALVTVYFSLVISSPAIDSNEKINYQGKLLNGTNLVNGVVTSIFRLYSTSSGGTLYFAQTQVVTVVDGLYSTTIGRDDIVPSLESALQHSVVFIEVEVNGTILSPRERIHQAAYSLTDVDKAGDTMTGTLTVQTNISLSYSADRGFGPRNMLTISGGDNVEIGDEATGYNYGTAVGGQANGYDYGTAIGSSASGGGNGAAVGYSANGHDYGAAVGSAANGSAAGAALGWQANGTTNGAAVGRDANGNAGAAMGYQANGAESGAAVGYQANADNRGVAMGHQANGSDSGTAVGYQADGVILGAAVGFQANAYDRGATLGSSADANGIGAAVGYWANGSDLGVAVGAIANGFEHGVAVGENTFGDLTGVAVGREANGRGECIAVGAYANSGAASHSIALGMNSCVPGGVSYSAAIGHDVTNDVIESTRVRGTLYIDGTGTADANIKYRQTFGSGGWSTKAFTIDHPLDPQNKVLRHYCVEGPVVQNMYNGSVMLDGKGEAMVAMPPYFDALNINAQYVLTPIGASMPNLHVMQKIHENRFWIAGGAPAGEVSWMVVAQRNDPACVEDLKKRPVEQLKSELKPGQAAAENAGVNADASTR